MEQTKIDKETKQKIALNYAISKNKDAKLFLIDEINRGIELYHEAILKINNVSKEDFSVLIDKINTMKNETIRKSFFSTSINFKGFIAASGTHIVDIKHESYGQNDIFIYNVSSNNQLKSFHDNPKVKIDENNFNYSNFINKDDDLFEDKIFKKSFDEINSLYDKYKNDIQTSYNNCYELIRSIRTLERIEKSFPDVNLYLPDEITVKEDGVSIQKRFEEL